MAGEEKEKLSTKDLRGGVGDGMADWDYFLLYVSPCCAHSHSHTTASWTETRGAESTGLAGRQNTSVVSQWSVACNVMLSFTCLPLLQSVNQATLISSSSVQI